MNTKLSPIEITFSLAVASVSAALVCITTIFFRIDIPATSGYFNIGEAIIYVTALLFGSYVGGIAGGLGAALADLLGYPVFAPGTLVIKGLEGVIVGFLNRKLFKQTSRASLSAVVSMIAGGLEMVAGYFIYETAILKIGVEAAIAEVPFNIVQMLVGLVIAIPLTQVLLRIFPQLKAQQATKILTKGQE